MSFNVFPQTLCSGDIYPLKLTFTDKTTGNPYNLTGATISATIKVVPDNNPDTEGPWMQDVVGDATGVIQFNVGPLNAGDYWFDVKMNNGTTPPSRSTILAPLQMHVIQSVTLRL